ncbi:MAG TPA: glycosyltransferase family 4 protein [Tepidanaerobacter syntrophicus]|uniref:glycosyltransferase family 4 protein n=1 Tax=Tepidanaerobacter syntrophicus TaxID=224999 RepID=UPI001752A20B|nr:glycosyltransferase family 4 protein [Tepidanaerobacter syntrophicus]HHV84016.1 glycosyltransferase family 4 protein [Tepidanaerobacter syntrophicus]
MKILYVTTVSNTVNAFLIPQIRLLVDRGHQVDVAFSIVHEVDPEIAKLGCKVHNVEFQRSPLRKENYVAYNKIKKIITDGRYDIVHVHTPVASFVTRLACRNIHNLTVIYTVHGFHFFKGAPTKNWLLYYPLEKLAAKWTDVVITMNEEDYISASKMKCRRLNSVYRVNGVGVNLEKFSPVNSVVKKKLREESGFNNEDFILFYAAELNYNKHQDLLIKTINLLKNKIPNIKLLLAGDGNLQEEYEKQAKNLGLSERIHFLGYREDVSNLLKISDVAVASSRREGLPVNVIEAMATGLPLIVTDCRGQRDLVSDGENGYVVGIDDAESFVTAIIKLYHSKDTRLKFSQKNIELSKKYSISRVMKEMENIFEGYLNKQEES